MEKKGAINFEFIAILNFFGYFNFLLVNGLVQQHIP